MFKTNSRKGLSLAAIVALVASALSFSAPAQAAGEVSLETKSGTTYAALAGTTFSLTVNAGSLVPASSFIQLKTKVTNTGGTTYSATVSPTNGNATATGNVASTTSGTILKLTAASNTDSSAVITLLTANSSSDAVLTLQSWLDANNNDTIDSSEFVSEVRTVTFYKTSSVTWTTTLTAPSLAYGNSTLSAVVSTAQGINMAQLDNTEVQVAFATVAGAVYTRSGTATNASSTGVFTSGENTTVPTGTNTRKAELGEISISPATTYVAVAVVDGAEAGSEVYSVVGAAGVSAIEDFAVTEDANAVEASGTATTVRAGSAIDLEYTAAVSKSAGVKAAAGTLVTVTVTEDTLTSVSAVVGGGKTLSNASSTTSEKITFTVAVAADGTVTVPLKVTLKDGQKFTIKLSAETIETSAVTVTAADTAFGSIVDLNTIGSEVIKVASGTATTLKWAVLDNFGEPLTGDFRVYLTNDKSSATVSAAVSSTGVSFSVTPTATTTYTALVQKYNTSSLTYVEATSGDDNDKDTHQVTVGASNAASAVTLTATTTSDLALNNKALKAIDTRLGGTAPTLTTGNRATLSGQVTDVNGVATYGTVTLTAPNVMFKVGEVYTLGSATVRTSATGAYGDIVVYSNKAGKVTVSATVGSATKDLGLTFAAAADTAGAKWVVTVPTYVTPGSTAQVKAQLLDTWSNPVKVTTTSKISVTYTGPGFVTGSLPNTTDADGMLSFSVLFGSADTGTATVKFSYDGDATASTTGDNVASSGTMTLGTAPTTPTAIKATIGTFTGYVAVFVKGAAGKKLSVKVAGKWAVVNPVVDGAKGYYLFKRNTGAGYTAKVEVYVDGSLVANQTITTK